MKKTNQVIKILMFLTGIAYAIKYFIDKDLSYTLISLSLLIIIFVPDILRKFKIKVLYEMEFLFLLFILLAQVFGSMMQLYDAIHNFDKFVHFTSGIVSAFVGVYLLTVSKKYDKKTIAFNIMFIIFTSLAVAGLWEMFEYTCDNILKNDAQRVAISGVNDTMLDIIMAFLASILVSGMYLYEELLKKPLIVKKFIKQLDWVYNKHK